MSKIVVESKKKKKSKETLHIKIAYAVALKFYPFVGVFVLSVVVDHSKLEHRFSFAFKKTCTQFPVHEVRSG